MTLSDLYYSKPRPLTDKGECHDYINSYYTHEFADKKDLPIKMLEIGLFKGGSANLWLEWFTNIELHGIEIMPLSVEGVDIYVGDAYTTEALSRYQDEYFDYIIDDGPHSVESQIAVINMYLSKLKINGKMIIEDVQSIDYVPVLEEELEKFNVTHKVFDMRSVKGRYDDIIIEITKHG